MINVHTVAYDLQTNGWELISTQYKNLNTELEMKCPKGHTQFITYGNWRKHHICNVCMGGDASKINKNVVPPKSENTLRVLALDASTSITGYAIFDNRELVSFGVFKTDKSMETEQRINAVKKWLIAALQDWEPDFVGIENIQLQMLNNTNTSVNTYRTLANLQGVLIDTVYEACIDHDLVYASSWRQYCDVGDGRGRESKKKQAQDKVKLWYGQDCTQDEADAICIGKYFCNMLKKSTWGEEI